MLNFQLIWHKNMCNAMMDVTKVNTSLCVWKNINNKHHSDLLLKTSHFLTKIIYMIHMYTGWYSRSTFHPISPPIRSTVLCSQPDDAQNDKFYAYWTAGSMGSNTKWEKLPQINESPSNILLKEVTGEYIVMALCSCMRRKNMIFSAQHNINVSGKG